MLVHFFFLFESKYDRRYIINYWLDICCQTEFSLVAIDMTFYFIDEKSDLNFTIVVLNTLDIV